MDLTDNTQKQNGDNTQRAASESLSQLALTLYECPGGALVTKPADCREGLGKKDSTLPDLKITG